MTQQVMTERALRAVAYNSASGNGNGSGGAEGAGAASGAGADARGPRANRAQD